MKKNTKLTGKSKDSSDKENQELSAIDQKALADFCSSFDLEEITYDKWANSHHSLDLQIPLFLSPDEAQSGGHRFISYTIKIALQDAGKTIWRKQKPKKKLPGQRIPKISSLLFIQKQVIVLKIKLEILLFCVG